MVADRRQYRRLILDPLLSVCMGESNSGLLLDLSEGGVAVGDLAPEGRNEVISLSFDLPEVNGHIQAGAQIAWTGDSGRRIGVRFVDLANSCRRQLREWIFARVDTTGIAPNEEQPAESVFISHVRDALVDQLKLAEHPPQLSSESESEKLQFKGGEGRRRYGKSRQLMRPIFAGVLVSSVFVFSLGYYLGHLWRSREAKSPVPQRAAEVPEPTSKTLMAPVNRSPATTPPVVPAVSLDRPGFVLQVATMTHEDKAEALAEALRQRNLPAFVFRRGSNRFYIVAVGPYGDADSAVTVRAKLQGQGFHAILRRWSPE